MSNFSWVEERAACSLSKVFETLKLQIQEDVDARNKVGPNLVGYKFDWVEEGNVFRVFINKLSAAAAWPSKPSKAVVFRLFDDAIQVTDKGGNEILRATLTLNDLGECKIRIKDQERELWQMRRAALEGLFFNTLTVDPCPVTALQP